MTTAKMRKKSLMMCHKKLMVFYHVSKERFLNVLTRTENTTPKTCALIVITEEVEPRKLGLVLTQINSITLKVCARIAILQSTIEIVKKKRQWNQMIVVQLLTVVLQNCLRNDLGLKHQVLLVYMMIYTLKLVKEKLAKTTFHDNSLRLWKIPRSKGLNI